MIEAAVVVDPAANARIVHRSQVLEGFVAAVMKRPAPNCSAHGLERRRTRRGHEAMRRDVPLPDRFPCSECEAEEVERLVRIIAAPICILAVDDLRLLRMQHQLADREAVGNRAPECSCLLGAPTHGRVRRARGYLAVAKVLPERKR